MLFAFEHAAAGAEMTSAELPTSLELDGLPNPADESAGKRAMLPHTDQLQPGDDAYELYRQVERAVETLNDSLKIVKSAATENLIAYLTLAVFESGRLERVDRVVLEPSNNSVVALQLLPYQRSHKQLSVATKIATAADAIESGRRLAELQAHFKQHGRLPPEKK
jgi:hypothetical protein